MLFSRHSHRWSWSKACASVILISMMVLSGLGFSRVAAHADTLAPAQATTGLLAPATVVDLRHPQVVANDTGPSLSYLTHSKGVRPTRPPYSAQSTARLIPQAPLTPMNASSSAVAPLLQNFNGVGSGDSAATNFGSEFEPPDQGLCVGNGFVIDAVNSAVTIYHTNGSVAAGPFNVNVLFNEGLKQFTSDPRCYFDPATHTWYAIILFINATNTRARTDIAVNPSGDPTTKWLVYHLDATDDGTGGTPNHVGCPCFGDQPLLGIDSENLYISTNEFSILGPQFNGAQVYAVSRSDLVSLGQSVHFVDFQNLAIDGTLAASVQPAITRTNPGAEYFLNSLDPNGTGDTRIGVWALTNQHAVSTGGLPVLSNYVITSTEAYSIPPPATQKGATSTLDSGDDRMQQVQFIGGEVIGALGTAITPSGSTTPRAGIAWFAIQPVLSGSSISNAVLQNQGYVAAANNNLIYPAIQASPHGTMVIVCTLTGPQIYPSAAYVTLATSTTSSGQTNAGTLTIAAPGTGPYDPTATRWGDYSFAILDPSETSIWLATEYIPPVASQTPDRLRNWGTRVMEVAAGI